MQTSKLQCKSTQKLCVEQLCLNDAKANAAVHAESSNHQSLSQLQPLIKEFQPAVPQLKFLIKTFLLVTLTIEILTRLSSMCVICVSVCGFLLKRIHAANTKSGSKLHWPNPQKVNVHDNTRKNVL